MAMEGTLADFNVIQVFQQISQGQKTGILTIYSGQDTVTVSFQAGMIVAASSANKRPEEKLGSFLLRKGFIDEPTLQKALENQAETFDRLGQILLKKKLIDKTALQEALRSQLSQMVSRLLNLDKGFYHFKVEDKVHYDEENIKPIPVETVLMAGVEQAEEAEKLAQLLPPDAVFQKTERAEELIRQDLKAIGDMIAGRVPGNKGVPVNSPLAGLSPFEKQLLGKVDATKNVSELATVAAASEAEVTKTLMKLLEEGLIDQVAAKPAPKPGVSVTEEEAIIGFEEEIDRAPLISYAPFLILPLLLTALYFVGFQPFRPFTSSEVTTLSVFDTAVMEVTLDKALTAAKMAYYANGKMPDLVDDLTKGQFLGEDSAYDLWGNKLILVPDSEHDALVIISRGPDQMYPTSDDIRLTHQFHGQGELPVAFFPGKVAFPASVAPATP